MEILAVPAAARGEFADLIDSMHRLRACVFGDRLDWDVEIRDGREADAYDQFDPTYILSCFPHRCGGGLCKASASYRPDMLVERSVDTKARAFDHAWVSVRTARWQEMLANTFPQLCSPASSNGRWRTGTTRLSPQLICVSSAF